MAKPFAESAGCSLHVHVSLLDEAGRNVFAGHERGRPFSDTLAPRDRRARGARWPNPWRSSRRPRTPIGATGPACSCRWRRTGASTTAACRCASRCRAPRTRASSTGPGGADGNPYLVMAAILAGIHHGIANSCDPGPMVSAAATVIEEKIMLPLRWDAALDAFEAGKVLPEVSRRALSQAVCDLPARGMRTVSCGDHAIATTSGTCARSDAHGAPESGMFRARFS